MLKPAPALLAVAAVAALLSGCVGSAPDAPADPPAPELPGQLPALAAGRHWELRAEAAGWLNYTVEAVEAKNGVESYRILERRAGAATESQTFWHAVADYRQHAIRTSFGAEATLECDPQMPGYPPPNGTADCSLCSGGRTVGAIRVQLTPLPLTLLDTPSGKVWAVGSRSVDHDGNVRENWFSPVLGHPVRHVDQDGNDYRLASHG